MSRPAPWYTGPRAAATLATLVAALAYPRAPWAIERHFTYTYETGTLPSGVMEIEPWTTLRVGSEADYAVFLDHRLEFELGLTDTLQTAWYINFGGEAVGSSDDVQQRFVYRGISWEWKWKLADPVADPIGVALYWELGGGLREGDLEFKLLLDKRWGDVLVAFNAVVEAELEREDDETEAELVIEADLALAYFLSRHLWLGLELRNHTEVPRFEQIEHTTLLAGPVVGFAQDDWWASLTVLPQVLGKAFEDDTDGLLVLDEHQRIEARLLFGMHL